MTPEEFAARLQRSLPDGLRSVVLYGSAASGDFVRGVSHYDLLVVVDQLGPGELANLASPVRDWQSLGNPVPQIFTEAELKSSADAFPLELLDMQQSHRVLSGSDPLSEIQVHPSCLRLQLERELKGKLLLLRERYLVAHGKEKRVVSLLVNSVSTFLVLFRGALRLFQETIPAVKVDALNELARHVSFDPEPFQTVLLMKAGTQRQRDIDVPGLFRKYLTAIEQIVSAVDRHLHAATPQEQK